MRILLVEDDSDTASYVVEGLQKRGHLADHAAGGQDGLLRALSGRYDVLIVDRMLPEIDWLCLVRTLRSVGDSLARHER